MSALRMLAAGQHMSKERPILFSGPMVRAILEGRKTETRRLRPLNVEPGDTLWVRETWRYGAHMNEAGLYVLDPSVVHYRADLDVPKGNWRPSIFMPRCASRLTLEVLEVRIERLHDITTDALHREGLECRTHDREPVRWKCPQGCEIIGTDWIRLWDSINGKRKCPDGNSGAWDANPMVQVITFTPVRLP